MLASRPGLGLKAIQHQFLEVLVLRYLVLVNTIVVLVLADMVVIISLL